MRLIFIDIETNTEHKDSNCIVQLWAHSYFDDWTKNIDFWKYYWLKEWEKISLWAMNITWITNKKVQWLKTFEEDNEFQELVKDYLNNTVFVAHNWEWFDFPVFSRFWIEFKYKIDTLRVARILFRWKEDLIENSFKLWVLRYYYEERDDDEFTFFEWKAHEACFDCKMNEYVLFKLIEDYQKETWKNDKEVITDFINMSKIEVLSDKFIWWKYKWEDIWEVVKKDNWYISWIIKNIDSEEFMFKQVHLYFKNWIWYFKDEEIIELNEKYKILESINKKLNK